MADNYQKFSEIVPGITARERAWVERVLGATQATPEQVLRDAGIKLKAIDLDDWPGFTWEFEVDRRDLWLYAEEYGDLGNVAEFVRAFLAKYRPNDCWHVTWSETCSKPRAGEFGGGGLFVTARSYCFLRAGDWVQRRRNAFQRRYRTEHRAG